MPSSIPPRVFHVTSIDDQGFASQAKDLSDGVEALSLNGTSTSSSTGDAKCFWTVSWSTEIISSLRSDMGKGKATDISGKAKSTVSKGSSATQVRRARGPLIVTRNFQLTPDSSPSSRLRLLPRTSTSTLLHHPTRRRRTDTRRSAVSRTRSLKSGL